MADGLTLDELAAGVWKASCALRGGILSFNCYVVKGASGATAIEAGPADKAQRLIAAIASILPIHEIRELVLLDDNPFAASGAAAWRNAGFRGPIVADWRTALGLEAAEVPGPFRFVYAEAESLAEGGGAQLELRTFPGHPGRMCALHRASGCLFTGGAGSSMGKDLPVLATEANARPRSFFAESFGLRGPGLGEILACFGEGVSLACPRFGSALPAALLGGEAAPGSALPPGASACAEADGQRERDELRALVAENEALRADNLDLRSAMVTASDAALRDAASGLCGRAYAEVFLKALLEQGIAFSAAFVEVDKLREINRASGREGGDKLIADMALFLQERAAEGVLFRWSGPTFLLVIERDRQAAFLNAEALRSAVEAERRFSRPSTISVAIVGSDELSAGSGDAAIEAVQAISRSRLRILERRGGNDVLADGAREVLEKALVLVLDGDAICSDYIVEYLNRRGFSAIGADLGGKALELMGDYEPEVVVADAFLPQFDAFQIRARMLASADLRRVPFVLLAESKTEELVERAHSLRIYHVFGKPVPLGELAGVIRFLIDASADGN